MSPSTPAAPSRRAITSFTEFGLPEQIVRSLEKSGITAPFPIQVATLPDSLAGRDVIGRGRTGSGKTLAFAIPTVTSLARPEFRRRPKAPRALVLVPTRELAAQVAETLIPIAATMQQRVAVIHGGVPAGPQIRALATADIIVACPGRLEDLVSQHHCRLDNVGVTVLDEADHMADLGFLPGVKRLLDRTPDGGQRLLFSATLDNGVDVLVRRYLHNPVTHEVDSGESYVPEMEHHVFHVSAEDKMAVVQALASGAKRVLLFTRTKHAAKKLALQLAKHSITTVELHGNLSQNARTRNLDAFSTGEATVLVATDIAARGIHVDDIALVVHVDPPAEHKAFLHRSGRTARAGAAGTVVTIVTPGQKREVEMLTRRAGIKPATTSITPTHPLLTELVGPTGPRRAMAPRAAAPDQAPRAARPARPARPATARPAAPSAGGPRRSGPRPDAPRGGAPRSGRPRKPSRAR